MVDLILLDALSLRIIQADLLPRRANQAADGLEHRVKDRPGEVLLRVRQAGRVIGHRRLAQGDVPLALQVRPVQVPLPRGTVLHKVPGPERDEPGVLSDELLLPLGEP